MESGVLYPESPERENHIGLTAYALEANSGDSIPLMLGLISAEETETYRAKLETALEQEIRQSGCSVLILSNEHCSSRIQSVAEARRLIEFLKTLSEDIRIVCYLRRQDDALLSAYSTAVRNTWDKPIALPSEGEIERRYDYYLLLNRWAEAAGLENCVVRNFHALKDRDLLSDFIDAAGLSGVSITRETARLNPRLNAQKAEFLRLINYYFPSEGGQPLSRSRGDLALLIDRLPDRGPALSLPAGMGEQLMSMVRLSNRYVASRYFGDVQADGDPLFGPYAVNDPAQYSMTLEDFAEMTARIWQLKQANFRDLWEHTQRLEATVSQR